MSVLDGLIGGVAGGVMAAGASIWTTWWLTNDSRTQRVEDRLQEAIGPAMTASGVLANCLLDRADGRKNQCFREFELAHFALLSRLPPGRDASGGPLSALIAETGTKVLPPAFDDVRCETAILAVLAYQGGLVFLAPGRQGVPRRQGHRDAAEGLCARLNDLAARLLGRVKVRRPAAALAPSSPSTATASRRR